MDPIEKASDYAHEATGRIAGAAGQAAEMLGEKGEQLLNAEQKLMKHCCNYAKNNPATSLSIAVIVGFMLSRMLRHR